MITLRHCLLPLAIGLLTLTAPARRPDTRVYYFMMSASTYNGIDATSIEEKYDLTSLMRNDVGRILKVIDDNKVPGDKFDGDEIRLKIIPPKGDTVLCNLYGQLLIGKNRYTIPREAYNRIHRIIKEALPEN